MKPIILSVLLCGSVLCAGSPDAAGDFENRLQHYVKLRKQAASSVPPVSKKAEPEEIRRHQTALAQAIRNARASAKPGEILTPEVRPLFEKLLRGSLKSGNGANVRASIKEGNPKHEKAPGEVVPVVAVNAAYPTNAPLSTVPPSLLMKLPKLPPDIEYRFVGRTLVLRDRESNLIIDFMKDAVPAL